ncbi:homogentisate 1,2-dioxygenase [Sphingomonas nostoxanthinifaciens]|uniref:homogentisate 1,2-dioxygenase n=1 Tax=Sphingomonas nostoxanthinifaciens TaxID=2872652 RepID=UPI001CC1C5F7|nr:homogentisate 1,2-dioxygenase [Sphingomonas nostoxanthinifaciens]UAK24303.1 homogentisate 1,2-dioxygenase [Sphingomonas nostoxanthinifaciens]
MRMLLVLAAAFLAAGRAPAQAAEASGKAPACPAGTTPLPAALSGWSSRKPLVAAIDRESLDSGWLAPGIAVDLQLVLTSQVSYAHPPAHAGAPSGYGGMLAFATDHAGTVRVAIGSAASIDMIDSSGAPVAPTAYGHGLACAGIRQTVDFALKPGHYMVQIAGNDGPILPLLIAPLS